MSHNFLHNKNTKENMFSETLNIQIDRMSYKHAIKYIYVRDVVWHFHKVYLNRRQNYEEKLTNFVLLFLENVNVNGFQKKRNVFFFK